MVHALALLNLWELAAYFTGGVVVGWFGRDILDWVHARWGR